MVKFADMASENEVVLLTAAVRFVDNQLVKIDRESKQFDDPDESGHYDRGEYVIGLGFISCQRYISAVCSAYRIPKADALDMGPLHRSKLPFAKVANAAANYWKHHTDDDRTPSRVAQQASNERIFRQLGIDLGQSYVLSIALATLLKPHPARFRPLLPFLRQWRDIVASKPLR